MKRLHKSREPSFKHLIVPQLLRNHTDGGICLGVRLLSSQPADISACRHKRVDERFVVDAVTCNDSIEALSSCCVWQVGQKRGRRFVCFPIQGSKDDIVVF